MKWLNESIHANLTEVARCCLLSETRYESLNQTPVTRQEETLPKAALLIRELSDRKGHAKVVPPRHDV